MSRVRDEAEALATALEIGACDVAQVIAWSDAQLLREDPAPGALCEVSLSHDRYPQDVAGLLRQLPGAPDKQSVGRLLVALVDAAMRRHPSDADQIASTLYQMALADAIADPCLKQIGWWAWDALYLAEAGHIQESREQVIDQMAVALHEAAAEADIDWWLGVGSSDAA